MALSDFVPPHRVVDLPGGGQAKVRGLSIQDISAALADFADEVHKVFESSMEFLGDEEMSREDAAYAALDKALTEAPELMAFLVARASDGEDKEAEAAAFQQMPVTIQAQLVFAVLEATLVGDAELKKALEMVSNMWGRVQGIISHLGASGGSASAGKRLSSSRKGTRKRASTR